MIAPKLIIAGVEIPLEAFPASQEYARLDEGRAVHTMLNGAALVQTHFDKLVTRISGEGWAPSALDGVDWGVPVEISCIKPRCVVSNTVSALLPAARRSDLSPLPSVFAMAVVAGELVPTTVSMAGHLATAAAVPSATSYRFCYYPKLNFVAPQGVTESLSLGGATYSWSIEAREA